DLYQPVQRLRLHHVAEVTGYAAPPPRGGARRRGVRARPMMIEILRSGGRARATVGLGAALLALSIALAAGTLSIDRMAEANQRLGQLRAPAGATTRA